MSAFVTSYLAPPGSTGVVTYPSVSLSALPAYVAVRCPLCGADDYHVRFEDRLSGVSVDPQRHYTSTSSAYGEHGPHPVAAARWRACSSSVARST